MAGYDWHKGKSNNAVIAEGEGKYPISKITKSDLMDMGIDITLADAKLLAKHDYWKIAEWHHTSKHFNTTYYYDLYDLKEIISNDEHKVFLSTIKTEQKEKAEDIIYAQIQVTEFYKNRGSWIPETITLLAEVRNYNSTGDYCTYNFNRKKKSNIAIVYTMDKEEYNLKMNKIEFLKAKVEKKDRLDLLRSTKKELIIEYTLLLKKYSNNDELQALIQKIKNAKTVKSIYSIQKIITELVTTMQDAIVSTLRDTCVDGINLAEWVLLPQEVRHPAPQSVMDSKTKSGLGWNAFERKLKGD